MTQFWVTHGGERRGPYEESEILEAVELGTIRPTDLLWAEGIREAIPVYQVFAHLGAAASPPRPGAPVRRSKGLRVVDELAALSRGEVAYAGFWVRLAAAMLDAAILGVAGLAIGLAMLASTARGGADAGILALAAAIVLVIAWLYFSLMESSPGGATFGKRAFRLQVLTADRMQRASFLRATGRWAGRWISAIALAAGYLMQPFTARRQALHDLLAGTVVVARGRRARVRLAIVVLCLAPLALALLAGAAFKLVEMLGAR
jgi:uncharacterized RDD family membrane protein YckC